MLDWKSYPNYFRITRAINVHLNKNSRFKKTKILSYPLYLDIIPTQCCNLNCIFCNKHPLSATNDLSLESFNIIAKKLFPYALSLSFCSGGEPFLNKIFMEFLSIDSNYKIDTRILSNGTLLSEEICKKIMKNKHIKEFGFSLDGSRKETVESIRKGIDYQKVVANIGLMVEARSFYKQKSARLTIRYTIMKSNIEELPDLIRQASRWGIDKVIIRYLKVADCMDKDESLLYHPELAERFLREAFKVSKSERIKCGLIKPPPDAQNGAKPCNMPWSFAIIYPDGSLNFCYKNRKPVGNILEKNNFFDLWNNEQYQLIRKSINTDKPYFKYCSICDIRNGYGIESSHLKRMRDDLYEFDKDVKIKSSP